MLFVPRQVRLASLPAAAAMAKEEAKKEKKSKSKAAAASKTSPAPDARVLAAVAAFLESSGLPRTLAALQSEANLEGDSWRSSPVNLAEAISKLLGSSDSAPVFVFAAGSEQEKVADAVAEGKDAGKKKKSKKGGAEVVEPESKPSEPSAPEKPIEKEEEEEAKEKKRKKKKDSSSAGGDAGGEAIAVVKAEDDVKPDGKKKKSKKQDKDEDVEARLEKVELAVKAKFEAAGKLKDDGKKSGEEEPKGQNDEADKNGSGDGAPLDKGKKKKKSKSASETSDKADAGTAPAEVETKSNGLNENIDDVEKVEDVKEKKSKKKKKKSGSEENVLVEDEQVAEKDSAPKPDADNKTEMDIEKGQEDGKASTDDAVICKKRKLEEDITATEDDVKEPSTISKPNKRQKLSSEPKTVIAFQRVKLDDVKFADERLQDNSYWAKGGADSGYGAKAQEILGQVRGRGFRHEKTKKKRGTYRGGNIDFQTHSVKFANSDDE
ncbi:suppressor protein SRP40-like [Lolium rigidum]|uniref:suppressor protein SRP40-like n=1 Tax=Lolium rigidum TaxID=89674 RepID=UPI001F5C3199|nr:suppressor protein SRP40-like [Lolium rigidum]